MKNPLISIIVPCYNQAQYLDECLQSVLNQTYEGWECIIVNDGSPDNTEAIAKKWLEKDSRFKYVFKENGGVSSSRNLGIFYARGLFILPLDADDKIGVNYLKSSVNAFQNNIALKLVYCKAEKFGDEKGAWELPDFSLEKLASNNIIFCSAIFKKNDWENIGGYDEKMVSGLEDWEFWISLLKNNGEVLRIDEVQFYYRIKKSSRQQDLKVKEKQKLFEYISVKHADFMVKQFGSFMYLMSTINRNNKNLTNGKFVFKLFVSTCLRYIKQKLKTD